jgi:hypothetical protein
MTMAVIVAAGLRLGIWRRPPRAWQQALPLEAAGFRAVVIFLRDFHQGNLGTGRQPPGSDDASIRTRPWPGPDPGLQRHLQIAPRVGDGYDNVCVLLG